MNLFENGVKWKRFESPSVFCLALTLISAMHQHLSACLSLFNASLCPVFAANTNRAVLAEYMESIFVSIFVSFRLYSTCKITCICLWFTGWINGQTWPWSRWLWTVMENLEWEGSSVPKASKKTHLQPHLKQPSALKYGCIALFCVFKSENCYFLCFPGVFFCFLPKPLTYLACVEIKVIVNACLCFNLELD